MKDLNGTDILPGDKVVFYGQYNRFGSATRGLKFGTVKSIKTEQLISYTNETVYVNVEGPNAAVNHMYANYSRVGPMNIYVVEKGSLHNAR